MGFEDDTLVQPYFHAASEARVVFDALTAVDGWIRDRYPERFPEGIRDLPRVASGFSQGGHAALAAADRNATMGGDLYLHGVIGYGPTAQIEPMLQIYPSLGPMVAMSYLKVYGRGSFDPADMLREPWASELEYDTTRQCVGGIQGYYPSDPSQLYRAEFLRSLRQETLDKTHPVIHRIFTANLTGLARHNVPVLILQGTNDIVVSRSTQDAYVAMLRERGNPVDYRVFEGARHDTRQIGFDEAIAWMRDLNPHERPLQWTEPNRFDQDLDQ
jgi:acetyl esterase/lipase